MAIEAHQEFVLVAAFLHGRFGADISEVVTDLGQHREKIQALVASLYGDGFLENEGGGGAIIFNQQKVEELERIAAKYRREVEAFTPIMRKLLGVLNQQGNASGTALINLLSPASRQEIHKAVMGLVKHGAAQCPQRGPCPLEDITTEIEPKGRLLAKLLPATQPTSPDNPLEAGAKATTNDSPTNISPAKSLSFSEAAKLCGDAISSYRIKRTGLVRSYSELLKCDGGPWRATCKRGSQPGDLEIKGQILETTTDGQVSGAGIVTDRNPFSSINDFKLIDSAGTPPKSGSPVFSIQQQMFYYMDEVRQAANVLFQLLPQFEALAPTFGIDPTPLTQVRHRLPAFPYIPVRSQIMDIPTESGEVVKAEMHQPPNFSPKDREKAVADDEPFLAKAMLTLEHLVQAHWRAEQAAASKRTGTKPPNTGHAPGLRWSDMGSLTWDDLRYITADDIAGLKEKAAQQRNLEKSQKKPLRKRKENKGIIEKEDDLLRWIRAEANRRGDESAAVRIEGWAIQKEIPDASALFIADSLVEAGLVRHQAISHDNEHILYALEPKGEERLSEIDGVLRKLKSLCLSSPKRIMGAISVVVILLGLVLTVLDIMDKSQTLGLSKYFRTQAAATTSPSTAPTTQGSKRTVIGLSYVAHPPGQPNVFVARPTVGQEIEVWISADVVTGEEVDWGEVTLPDGFIGESSHSTDPWAQGYILHGTVLPGSSTKPANSIIFRSTAHLTTEPATTQSVTEPIVVKGWVSNATNFGDGIVVTFDPPVPTSFKKVRADQVSINFNFADKKNPADVTVNDGKTSYRYRPNGEGGFVQLSKPIGGLNNSDDTFDLTNLIIQTTGKLQGIEMHVQ